MITHLTLADLHIDMALEYIRELEDWDGTDMALIADWLKEAKGFLKEPERPAGEADCKLCFPNGKPPSEYSKHTHWKGMP